MSQTGAVRGEGTGEARSFQRGGRRLLLVERRVAVCFEERGLVHKSEALKFQGRRVLRTEISPLGKIKALTCYADVIVGRCQLLRGLTFQTLNYSH
jgi:hypothetical protein